MVDKSVYETKPKPEGRGRGLMVPAMNKAVPSVMTSLETPNSLAADCVAVLKMVLAKVVERVMSPRMTAKDHFFHSAMSCGSRGSSGPSYSMRNSSLKFLVASFFSE